MITLRKGAGLLGVLFAILASGFGAAAQAQTTWSRTYGGPLQDRFYRILTLPDGSYTIPSSFVNASGNWDGRLVTVAPTGDVLWAGAIGGPGNDFLYRMIPSSDGGYFLAGVTNSFGAGGDDVWLIKLDQNGDPSWQRAYGKAGNQELEAIVATSDGGAVLAADVEMPYGEANDAWVFRVSASGDVIWSESLGYDGDDYPSALLALPNGNFAMVGSTYAFGSTALGWLVSFKPDGSLDSQSAFGPSGSELFGEDVAAASDGNFFILGSSYDPPGNAAQVFIAKLNAQADSLWQESIGGADNDEAYRLVADDSGGCYVVGSTASFPGGGNTTDGWAAHLSGTGQVLWQKRYGESFDDVIEDAVPTPDGGLLMVGTKAYEGPGEGEGWLFKAKASDGSMDSSCTFVSPTSFAVTTTYVGPQALGATPVSYAAQSTTPDAVGAEVGVPSTVMCSSPLTCTIDGSAQVPAGCGAGVPVPFRATAVAPDCPDRPTFAWTFGDGGTSDLQNPSHTYAATGTYHWSVVMATGGHSVTRTGTIVAVDPPQVTAIKKTSPPFTLVVTGSNFQSGIQVFINGVLWSGVTYKNAGKIKLGAGASLKSAVPKGVATSFRFVNPDGGETLKTWQW